MFGNRGAVIFNADEVVHGLLETNGPVIKAVAKTFGQAVMSSGGINRKELSRIVFDDSGEMKKLTDILFPLARKKAESFVEKHQRRKLLVLDVPLLIEAGWDDLVDKVVVVRASRAQQMERVLKRSGLKKSEVLKRIKYQMPLREKQKYADYVIDNRGSKSDTDKQVQRIVKELDEQCSEGFETLSVKKLTGRSL